MKKNNKIMVIAGMLIIYIFLAVFFFFQMGEFSKNQVQLENNQIEMLRNKMEETLAGKMDPAALKAQLDPFVAQYPVEIFIHDMTTQQPLYTTMPTADIWSIRDLFHKDVILYKSQGPVTIDNKEYYVAYMAYNISSGVLIQEHFKSLLLYLAILVVIIILTLTIIIFMLVNPLEKLKKAIAKMNRMELGELIEDDNVIAADLNEFAQNLSSKTMRIASNYTDLEVALQVERERLIVMMDLSRAFIHDLKTPVHQTLLENEVVLEKYGDDGQNKQLEVLANYNIDRSDTILKQINEIISLMDAQVKDAESRIEAFDFIEMFNASWKLFQFFITKNALSFYPDIPEKLLVHLNQITCKLILHNMISNAVKYAKPETEITFIIEQPGANFFTITCINVADTENLTRMKESENIFDVIDNERGYSSGNGLYLLDNLSTTLGGKYELVVDDTTATTTITLPINQGGDRH